MIAIADVKPGASATNENSRPIYVFTIEQTEYLGGYGYFTDTGEVIKNPDYPVNAPHADD